MAKIISGADFDAEVLKSEVPVVVDFFATWCAPCKMIAPVIDEISAELGETAKFVKVDIDSIDSREIVSQYNIMSVPTLMFFKDGETVDTIIGAVPKSDISAKITTLIN